MLKFTRKPNTNQHLLWLPPPIGTQAWVIRTLHQRAQNVHSSSKGREKEHSHIKGAIKTHGYPNWAFIKSVKKKTKNIDQTFSSTEQNRQNIFIAYVAGLSEFSKDNIPVHFRPANTLKQKLVQLKDKTPRNVPRTVVYEDHCSEECWDLYIWQTSHSTDARHNIGEPTQHSAVHLQEMGHVFWTEETVGLREELKGALCLKH